MHALTVLCNDALVRLEPLDISIQKYSVNGLIIFKCLSSLLTDNCGNIKTKSQPQVCLVYKFLWSNMCIAHYCSVICDAFLRFDMGIAVNLLITATDIACFLFLRMQIFLHLARKSFQK